MTILLCTLAAMAASSPEEEVYLAAHAAEREGRTEQAGSLYQECAALEGTLAPYALVKAADCLASRDDEEGAEKAYRSVLNVRPNGPWARFARARLGDLLLSQKRHGEAHALLSRAAVLPVYPWWFDEWRWKAAKSAFDEPALRARGLVAMAELAEDARTRWYRGEAARCLAMSLRPESRLTAAGAFLDAGNWTRAEQLLSATLPSAGAGEPELRAVWHHIYLRSLLVKGSQKAAREALHTALGVHRDYKATRLSLLALLDDALSREDMPSAGLLVYTLQAAYPGAEETAEGLWRLGKHHERNSDLGQAIACFGQLASLCPDSQRGAQALLAAGDLLTREDEHRLAEARFRQLFTSQPASRYTAEAACKAGRILHARGKKERALAAFRVAAAGDVGDYYVYAALDSLEAAGERVDTAASRCWASVPVEQAPEAWLDAPWYRRLLFFGTHGLQEAEWEALGLYPRLGQLASQGPIYQTLGEAGLAATAGSFLASTPWGISDGKPTIGRRRAFFPRAYWPQVLRLARETGNDPYLLLAIGRQESTFRARISSSAGATGVMQLMPATAKWLAEVEKGVTREHARDLTRPGNSIRLGACYLARLRRQFDGDLVYALAAYNAGPGNVRKWQRRFAGVEPAEFVELIPFAETKGYVRRVLGNRGAYLSLYGGAG